MRAFMIRISFAAALCGGVLGAMGSAALAHVGQHAAQFAGGLAHPLTGLDHLLAALAVGLWASQLEHPARWLLPVVFPAVMILGALLASGGPALSMIEPAIAASVLILGALIAAARRPAVLVSAPLVALFALLHGYSHGLAGSPEGSILAYCFGIAATTLAVVGMGFGAGLLAARAPLRRAARTAGAAIAVGGAVLLLAA